MFRTFVVQDSNHGLDVLRIGLCLHLLAREGVLCKFLLVPELGTAVTIENLCVSGWLLNGDDALLQIHLIIVYEAIDLIAVDLVVVVETWVVCICFLPSWLDLLLLSSSRLIVLVSTKDLREVLLFVLEGVAQ